MDYMHSIKIFEVYKENLRKKGCLLHTKCNKVKMMNKAEKKRKRNKEMRIAADGGLHA